MKYRTRIILLVLLITTMLGGCDRMNELSLKENIEKEENYVLNERQKEILKKEGVKETEYKDLSESNQVAIRRIEEMLQYLEKKYDKKFFYSAYYEPGFMQDEMLSARVEGNPYDPVKVTRKWKDGKPETIEDTYIGVAIKYEYEKFFADYWSRNEGIKAVVISDIVSTNNLTLPASHADYADNVVSYNIVFIEENKNYKKMAERYKKWLKENSKDSENELVVLKKGVLKEVDKLNFEDFLDEKYITKSYSFEEEERMK